MSYQLIVPESDTGDLGSSTEGDVAARGGTQPWEKHTRQLTFVERSFYDTQSMELLASFPTGGLKEFKAVSHKLDQREKQSLIANLPATHWIWGQPLWRGKISKSWPRERAACHYPENPLQKGGNVKIC